MCILIFNFFYVHQAGLPHGQEKSRKTKKKDKSQEKSGKNGGFRKKSGKSQEIFL